jgi:alanyl-tRNA synthetase
MATERIYYRNPMQLEFDAKVLEIAPSREQLAVVLDRTAFYPTSGGQVFDTGRLLFSANRANVIEVAEREDDGAIVHYLAPPEAATAPGPEVAAASDWLKALAVGSEVRGEIDGERRRDHMQQHTGQHVLTAAFIRLYDFATVSFHMGAESCTIDLDTPSVTREQIVAAERLANEVIWEDRPVEIRFTSVEEARTLGLRKLPPREGEMRLIEVRDFDLCACGGTHVARTGQIGGILIRKSEKVRQGTRVEFVCGLRAVATARKDFETLTAAAELFSAHIYDVPGQIRKALDESKAASRGRQKLLDEIAEYEAIRLASSPDAPRLDANGHYVFASHIYPDRDAGFIKLVAQKFVAEGRRVVLLGALQGQPTVVLAQNPGMAFNCGAMIKDALAAVGARGGGPRDIAQGGTPDAEKLKAVIADLEQKLRK